MRRIIFIVFWGMMLFLLPMTLLGMIGLLLSFQRGDAVTETLTVTAEIASPICGIIGLVCGFRGEFPGTKFGITSQ